MLNKHSFHIVDCRPWPLINSLNTICILINITIYIKTSNLNINFYILFLAIALLILTLTFWWRDVNRERTLQGNHTLRVFNGLKISILLFISREIIFFFRFFWRYFHFRLAPEIEIRNNWPPIFIKIINPYHVPIINTIILLSSGATITYSHYTILNKNFKTAFLTIFITICLGIIFTYFQYIEYKLIEFSINDRVFGSIFFIITGFHGFHVIIGTLFILTNLIRLWKTQFRRNHHFRFEASAWYWHFVDIVWIYLYIFLYWWFYFLINKIYFILNKKN